MNYKVNENKWEELMYLINNFYKPIKYTCGKGLYPDRVTFVRSLNEESVFEPKREVEFFTMNARSVEDSTLLIRKTREVVESKVTDPYFMDEALNYGNNKSNSYLKLFEYVRNALVNSKTINFLKINSFLTSAYKNLHGKDALKVATFREEALEFCVKEGYVSQEYANQKMKELPNSLMKLTVGVENVM